MSQDFDNCRANPGKPCLYDVVEKHEGVTVEVLRCRRCGRRTIQWLRPEIAALQDAMTEGESKTAAEEPEPREYWEAAESWLRELQQYDVNAVAMVALIDDPDVHNVIVTHGTGPFELASMAGILQMLAAHKYGDSQQGPGEEDEDEEDDEDDV